MYQEFIDFWEGRGREFPCTAEEFRARAWEWVEVHAFAHPLWVFQSLCRLGGAD